LTKRDREIKKHHLECTPDDAKRKKMINDPVVFDYDATFEELAELIDQKFVAIPLCTHDHSGMPDWHIRNCTSPGKTPLVRWGDIVTTADIDLDRWLNAFPRFNVGLLTGHVNHIIGLDVDGALGRELLTQKCPDLPPTVKFNTAGGGERLLFRLPSNIQIAKRSFSRPGLVHEELSVLSDGSLTVMPPSIGANGNLYSYVKGHAPWEIQLALVPDSVIQLAGGNTSIDLSIPTYDAEAGKDTLTALAAKCMRFGNDWQIQREEGLDEYRWFCWCALLVNSGGVDAAWEFSTASAKHNARSTSRIQKLIHDSTSRTGGLVKCHTLTCSDKQVCQCFNLLDPQNEILMKKSPGNFILRSRSRQTYRPERPMRKYFSIDEMTE
jgi:hypothetical protein